MRPPIKYALREEGVSETNTSKVYSTSILAVTSNYVKKKIEQIVRSFRNEANDATIHHSQRITDPDGVMLNIVLEGATVSITDKEGRKVKFSAQLVPEVLGTLLDVEKIYYRGLSNGH